MQSDCIFCELGGCDKEYLVLCYQPGGNIALPIAVNQTNSSHE